MAHKSQNPWTTTSPAVLLGVRSTIKEKLVRSAVEMVYGTTLSLPDEFTEQYTVNARTDLDKYSDKLRVAMSRLISRSGNIIKILMKGKVETVSID